MQNLSFLPLLAKKLDRGENLPREYALLEAQMWVPFYKWALLNSASFAS